MKIYGGKRSAPRRNHEAVNSAPKGAPKGAQTPGSSQKPPRRRTSRLTKVFLAVSAVIMTLVLAGTVYVALYVKPPDVSLSNPPSTTTGTQTGGVGGSTSAGTQTGVSTGTGSGAATDATTAAQEDPLDALAEMAEDIDVSNSKQRDGVFTILLVGTDMDGTRTDSIVMITLDTKNKSVSMLNVPRDTMSRSAAGNIQKINAAFNKGIKRTLTEVKNLLGYEANRYVIVDYDAFENLIDAIGGVEIDVPRRMYYRDPDQDLLIDLQKGVQTLNGSQALGYMRFRKGYASQDLGRIEAQQELYKTVIKKMARWETLFQVNQLAEVFLNNVETNLSMGEMIWLAMQFYDMDTADIVTETIPTSGVTYNSLSYVVARRAGLLEMVNGVFNPYESKITNVNVVTPPQTTAALKTTQATDGQTQEGTQTSASTNEDVPDWLQQPGGTGSSQSTAPAAPPAGTDATTMPATTLPSSAAPPPAGTTTTPQTGGTTTGVNNTPPAWLG